MRKKKKKTIEERVNEIEEKIEKIEAKLTYLGAPHVIWNDLEKCWVFYPTKKFRKKKVYSMLFGKGEILVTTQTQKLGKKEEK